MKEYCEPCKEEHDYLETPTYNGRGGTMIIPLMWQGHRLFVKDSRLYMGYYDPSAQQHPGVSGF